MSANTLSTAPVRDRGGVQLPAPGTWAIDPGHADVAFVGRHMVFTKVRGRFADVSGAVRVADDPGESQLEVVIGMSSVESGLRARDEHLRSAELFDVEQFPTATFRSVTVDWAGTAGTVTGDLTIHGVTRRVPLTVVYEGYAKDPWGGERAVFSASTTVNREDFGLTWNVALEAGGLLVSKEISIEISVETVLQR
ncbi:YceI family protein [Motilibacter aurantiacus]|uniref:YceI family protein n=1 Tax=Motilibacter aurantiacus TaxID=2714955 RepID=UPI00140983EA|nr:YceI family protein [Motilibacter aurantiacus]NHC46960.1 YceI family protein [Motilibacter aurantiacus]